MTIRSLFLPASLAAILAIAGGASAAVLRPAIGTVDKVQASADAIYDESPRALSRADSLYFEDTLKTGPGARLQAQLHDGSQLTLGENAELALDDYAYRPWSDQNHLALNVAGAFLFVGGHIENGPNSKVEITTPVGTLGVRGTTVWGGAIDGGYGVLVLSGEVEVRTAQGTVVLHAGQGTMVMDGAAPQAAAPWPADRTSRAVKTISFAR